MGPAGDSLREIVTTIRGFSTCELDMRRERSWWEKLLGPVGRPSPSSSPTTKRCRARSTASPPSCASHEHKLLKDIKALDLLYDRTLAFYDELALYIAAGEEKLRELDAEVPGAGGRLSAAADQA